RFLRIFPIYYLTVFLLLAAGGFSYWLNSVMPPKGWHRAAYLLYLQNWITPEMAGFNGPSIMGHFWSLAVEEQFYIVWPLIVWKLRESVLLRVCVFGAACAFLLRVLLVSHFGPHFW